MQYTLLIFLSPSTKQYWGVFPELNSVSSFGDTVGEAQSNTKEAAELYLSDMEKWPDNIELGPLLTMVPEESKEYLVSTAGIEFWE